MVGLMEPKQYRTGGDQVLQLFVLGWGGGMKGKFYISRLIVTRYPSVFTVQTSVQDHIVSAQSNWRLLRYLVIGGKMMVMLICKKLFCRDLYG
jgi:hypothetical protein